MSLESYQVTSKVMNAGRNIPRPQETNSSGGSVGYKETKLQEINCHLFHFHIT